MLLGYTRGSVGDVTFTRNNGQQIARARNRKPKNPRSTSQMMQRSLFSSAVKMYQLATANFFQFAYEDRKPHESDYNAFMRHNVKQGTNITKACFNDRKYPAIGAWLFAQGSLPQMDYQQSQNTVRWYTGIKNSSSNQPSPVTVADLSILLTAYAGYLVGDMITSVNYGWSPYGGVTYPSIVPPTADHTIYFDYRQFVISLDDATALSSYGLSGTWETAQGIHKDELYFDVENAVFDEAYSSYCMIHTRNVPNGIQSSNAPLLLSGAYQQALQDSNEQTYIDQVLADWQAQEDAILNPKSGSKNYGDAILAELEGTYPKTIAANGTESMFTIYGTKIPTSSVIKINYVTGGLVASASFNFVEGASLGNGLVLDSVENNSTQPTITLNNTGITPFVMDIKSIMLNGTTVPIIKT